MMITRNDLLSMKVADRILSVLDRYYKPFSATLSFHYLPTFLVVEIEYYGSEAETRQQMREPYCTLRSERQSERAN